MENKKKQINLEEQIGAKRKELESKMKERDQVGTIYQNFTNEIIGLAKVVEYLESLQGKKIPPVEEK